MGSDGLKQAAWVGSNDLNLKSWAIPQAPEEVEAGSEVPREADTEHLANWLNSAEKLGPPLHRRAGHASAVAQATSAVISYEKGIGLKPFWQ